MLDKTRCPRCRGAGWIYAKGQSEEELKKSILKKIGVMKKLLPMTKNGAWKKEVKTLMQELEVVVLKNGVDK